MKKTTLRFLMICTLTLGAFISISSSASATEKAMFPMEYLNISQGVNGQYSHMGRLAIDIWGKNSGIDAFYAPFTGTIKKIHSSNNVVWLESNSPVEYADGTVDYMTIMCMHDNDISDLWVGKTIKQGEHFYSEGIAGNATGNHVHLECGKGKFTGSGWYENSYGKWCINNGINPWQALYLSESTIVGEDFGYPWKKTVITQPPSNPWISVDKYNTATNTDVTFTYYADNAGYYEIWLFKDGICLGNTPLPMGGTYTTKFSESGYYQAYISSSNLAGYVDSGKIEFNIYDNVPPDPWIYADKYTLSVGEEVRFVYNASYVTHFSLGIDRYGERVISAYRGWNETTYTTSFGIPGTYTAYISAYNDFGYADSKKVIFTVHDKTVQNLGDVFFGKILNKSSWTPIQNNNTKLNLCKEKGDSNELWKFVRKSDGSYEIQSCTKGEFLIATSDTKVCVGNTNESTDKQWFIYNYGNGIVLKPKCTENVLALKDGNTDYGTEVVLSLFNGNNSQIFNVYQGSDIQLTSPTLSITSVKHDKVTIKWSAVSCPSNYKIIVYDENDLSNPVYTDDTSWDTTTYTLKLPTGRYVASVKAYNYFGGMNSNNVNFSLVTPISTSVSKNNNTLNFTSTLNVDNASGSSVLLTVFDESGKMIGLRSCEYKSTVSFSMPYNDTMEYAKVLVFNKISGLKPLCENEYVPVNDF